MVYPACDIHYHHYNLLIPLLITFLDFGHKATIAQKRYPKSHMAQIQDCVNNTTYPHISNKEYCQDYTGPKLPSIKLIF